MGIIYENRLSDSPLVERVWRSRSEAINRFTSIAEFHWDLVVWTEQGKTQVNIQGPATHAFHAPVPEDAEFFGIIFRPGVYVPLLPVGSLINHNVSLPNSAGQGFWLNNRVWQLPNFENAETFVDHLARDGALTHEPVVEAVLRGYQPAMSLRSIQRRFLHATGLTYRTMQQIERARRAAILLQQGVSILDTAFESGYYDQAHLTKSLKYFIGQTPMQIIQQSEQLSLLYNTPSFDGSMMVADEQLKEKPHEKRCV